MPPLPHEAAEPHATAPAFPFGPGAGAVRVALALHRPMDAGAGVEHNSRRTPDFAPHLDLFVGAAASADFACGADPEARAARAWRVELAAWRHESLATGLHAAREIAPHRALYLALAARRELTDGRGSVLPLVSFDATAETRSDGSITILAPAIARRLSMARAAASGSPALADGPPCELHVEPLQPGAPRSEDPHASRDAGRVRSHPRPGTEEGNHA